MPFREFFELQWQDYLDILIVAAIIYSLYIWLKGTRAFQILIGLAVLGATFFLARWSGLFLTSWLFQYLWAVIVLIVVVIFQPEIRQMLERVSPVKILRRWTTPVSQERLTDISEACFHLAEERIGALIVMRRQDPLRDQIRGGIAMDALVSQELLITIFQHKSQIHDGAVVIHNNRLTRAGCYLPLSTNEELPLKYGTRHRAGIGITEQSDAITLIVSEERGEVSIARSGTIMLVYSAQELTHRLAGRLSPPRTFSQRSTGGWTRGLTRNGLVKVGALFFSVLLWALIVGQERSIISVSVPLEYQNIPPNLDIVGKLPNRLDVRIRGPRGTIAVTDIARIRARIDLSTAKAGSQTVPITEDDISMPFGLEITAVEPPAVQILLEPIETKRFEVRAQLVGRLPAGFILKNVEVIPDSVALQGVRTGLAGVQYLTTEPIDISSVRGRRHVTSHMLIIPTSVNLPTVRLPKVSVTLEVGPIEEEPLEKKPASSEDPMQPS